MDGTGAAQLVVTTGAAHAAPCSCASCAHSPSCHLPHWETRSRCQRCSRRTRHLGACDGSWRAELLDACRYALAFVPEPVSDGRSVRTRTRTCPHPGLKAPPLSVAVRVVRHASVTGSTISPRTNFESCERRGDGCSRNVLHAQRDITDLLKAQSMSLPRWLPVPQCAGSNE